MKALITGFELDAACPINSSYEVMKKLPSHVGDLQVVTDALRCDYRDPIGVVRALCEKHQPDVFICMGQALRREVISLEKVAINYAFEERDWAKDDDGFIPKGMPIVEGGPDGIFTNLPIDKMLERLKAAEFPCEISLTAGSIGCNNAMYSVLYLIKTKYPNMMGGFIHVPGHHEHPRRVRKTFSVQEIARGVEAALKGLND